MNQAFVISDTHFDHANMITKLKSPDGSFVRGQFRDVDEMNEYMVERWNAVVPPTARVYHLGDVSISRKGLRFVSRLHGRKKLVGGNHDLFKLKDYLAAGFEEVCGVVVRANVIMTHVPIHETSVGRFLGNAHGHIHTQPTPPGKFINCCVEALAYQPIALDDLVARFKALS